MYTPKNLIEFYAKDGKMNLTATDEWSPSYTDMVKK